MSNYSDSLRDYVDVAERSALLFAKYPDASWQTSYEGTVQIGDQTYLIVKATIYRTPDDPRPAIDYAWELIPGRTPYTKGSELMVGSTSAIGRAIAGLGIGSKRSISTRDEIKAAQSRAADFEDDYETPKQVRSPNGGFTRPMMTKKQQELIMKLVGGRIKMIEDYKAEHNIDGGFTTTQASAFIEYLKSHPLLEDPWAADVAKGGSDE